MLMHLERKLGWVVGAAGFVSEIGCCIGKGKCYDEVVTDEERLLCRSIVTVACTDTVSVVLRFGGALRSGEAMTAD